MLSFIKGEILSKSAKSIVLLVNNIGYKIFLSSKLLDKLKIGDTIELHTYLRHKDDEMSLYGFSKPHELHFFELLIFISCVSNKSALRILEFAKLCDIKKAILHYDTSILYKNYCLVNKTTERIIMKLTSIQ